MKRNKKITESEVVSESALVDTTKIKVGTDNVGITLAKASSAIKNIEDISTAMIHTAQQYTMAIEDILADEFGFSDDDLKKLEGRLKVSLSTLAQLESKGFNILSINDMRNVGEIAKAKFFRLAKKEPQKVLPMTTKDFQKFLGEEKPKKKKKEAAK